MLTAVFPLAFLAAGFPGSSGVGLDDDLTLF